jgi:hypothetical protein
MKPLACLFGKHRYTDAKADLQPAYSGYRTLVCEKCYHLIITDSMSIDVLKNEHQYYPSTVTQQIEKERQRKRNAELIIPGFIRGYLSVCPTATIQDAEQAFERFWSKKENKLEVDEINQLIKDKKFQLDGVH